MKYKNKEKGFSLVELMVVVAIIGILSALAIPRFKVFQAKARQAEAKSNLSHIFTLEQSYQADEDTYVEMAKIGNTHCSGQENQLGFQVEPCKKARYTYEVPASTVTASKFTAQAQSGIGDDNKVMPGCGVDEWQIDQDKTLKAINLHDVTRSCREVTK